MHPTMIPSFPSCNILLQDVKLHFLPQRSEYSIYYTFVNINLIFSLNNCFPHIVNLACKAMLSVIENEEDCIKKLRDIINKVSL